MIGSSTTNLLYDAADLIAEYDAAGTTLQRRYVHGPGTDEPIVWYEGPGTTAKNWFYADHLGSIVATANATGASTGIYSYGPYGEPNTTTGPRFRYTGQQLIGELGLYYYKARFYSPSLGRFLQTDPIGYKDDVNLYAYVGNNPANRTDPSGLSAREAAALAGGIARAASDARAADIRTLNAITSFVGQRMNLMQDVCSACSTTSFNQMGFVVPLVNTQALGSGISATYHASDNVAVIHPDFFASNRIDQVNVVAHEYLHSLPENRALVSAATAEQATMPYETRPWEAPALHFGSAFADRFAPVIQESFTTLQGRRR